MKIYIAGHRGLVGSALVREVNSNNRYSWIGQSRTELDLLDRAAVFQYVAREKPDAVILAAAKVGGIKANSNYPVEFLSQNLQIETNVIDAANSANIEKFLFLGSSCIYPKYAKQPIHESSLLTGELEPSNEPYAIAKIAGLKLINAYRTEFGRTWVSAMPTNVYGPNDNFDTNTSHVLPALIHKIHHAKINNLPEVTLWGTGNPLREFIHADDLASALIFLLENFNSEIPINVGTGQEVTILELSQIVSRTIGYTGLINWDSSMPDGTPRKILDSSNLEKLGWKPKISLEDGISSTYSWFIENYKH